MSYMGCYMVDDDYPVDLFCGRIFWQRQNKVNKFLIQVPTKSNLQLVICNNRWLERFTTKGHAGYSSSSNYCTKVDVTDI